MYVLLQTVLLPIPMHAAIIGYLKKPNKCKGEYEYSASN